MFISGTDIQVVCTIQKWCGNDYEARPGCPFSVRNEGLIAKVSKRIQEEHSVAVRMMADEFGVNRETIR